jgi:hypothetical protein
MAGVKLELSLTLGDLIVSGTMVVTIIGAYYAIKGTLQALRDGQREINRRLEEHGEKIEELDKCTGTHAESLARLDEHVFGRRRSDRDRR